MKDLKRFKIFGYLPNWGNFTANVHNIDYSKLTHIIISFINPVDEDGNLGPVEGLDEVVAIAHSHNVKVLISLGGAIINMTLWAELQQDSCRTFFVNKILQLVLKYDIDGVDVDLEGENIGENYEKFVIALSDILKPHAKLLTGAVAQWSANKITDVALARFDFINMMAYDEKGNWAPEFPGQHSSFAKAQSDISYWKGRGIDAQKLILGVPFYGYGFNAITKTASYHEYKDIAVMQTGAEYADEIEVTDGFTIYYNGIPTIKDKTSLAIRETGGVLIWHLLNDAEGTDSLLTAIDEAIAGFDIKEELIPALTKERWVFATIDLNAPLHSFLFDTVLPLADKVKKEEYASEFIYTSGAYAESILLFFKTTAVKSKLYLKPEVIKSFSDKNVDYQDFYILNLGTYNTSSIAEELFVHSGEIAVSLMQQMGNDWNTGIAIQKAIPLHLMLADAFQMNVNDMYSFYSFMIRNSLELAKPEQNKENWKEILVEELEENFQGQKEGLINYIEYLLESFSQGEFRDEEWNDRWKAACEKAFQILDKMQISDRLMLPYNFEIDNSSGVEPLIQKRWPLLEQYTKFINGQLGIGLMSGLSLFYVMKESLKHIREYQKI